MLFVFIARDDETKDRNTGTCCRARDNGNATDMIHQLGVQ